MREIVIAVRRGDDAPSELLHELGNRILKIDAKGVEVPIDHFKLDERSG